VNYDAPPLKGDKNGQEAATINDTLGPSRSNQKAEGFGEATACDKSASRKSMERHSKIMQTEIKQLTRAVRRLDTSDRKRIMKKKAKKQ
jgi:hypothetical protein